MIKQKNNTITTILYLSLLSLLYFISRLQNLTSIPVFADEAIYIRWSQIIRNVETLRFIPLTDGKQPLFMWLLAFGPIKFLKDPLVAGRLISVVSGWISLLTLFVASCFVANFNQSGKDIKKFIFSSIQKKTPIGLIACLIYLLLPFTFFFDRLALPDNLLSSLTLLSFPLCLLLTKFPRLDLAIILGSVLGLAWLTKSPAIYYLALSFVTFLFVNYRHPKTLIFPLISTIIAFFIYNILRLGPQFHMIASRNKDYVWPLVTILQKPLDPLVPHLSAISTIYQKYIHWLVLIPAVIGLMLKLKNNKLKKTHLILLSWWLLPLIATASLAKVFTARYILSTTPFLIILLALGLNHFIRFKYLLLLLFIPNIIWMKNISLKPFDQKLPATESGYTKEWTSGWGIKQAADYFKARAKVANVIVGTEGSFGTLPDGLQIYTDSIPQLTIIGQGLGFTSTPDQLINAKNHGDEVYLLINQSRLSIIDQTDISLFKKYPKPDGDQLLLFQL